MALPHHISRADVTRAIAKIRTGQIVVPVKNKIRIFAIRYKGADYPPKHVIRIAGALVGGKLWDKEFSGGTEANNFLIVRRFEIWNTKTNKPVQLSSVLEYPPAIYREGKITYEYKRHRKLERDTRIAKHAKNAYLSKDRTLPCEVCGFSFRVYGDLGTGYIEAHHKVPVHSFRGERITDLKEIALVCSNCHRMIHRSKPMLTIEELKQELRSSRP